MACVGAPVSSRSAGWVRIVPRRFEPQVHFRFQLCRMPASQNSSLVEAFFHEVRQVADEVFHETLNA